MILLNGVFEIIAVTMLLVVEIPHRLPISLDNFLSKHFGFATDPVGRILFATYLAFVCLSLRGEVYSTFTLGVTMLMVAACLAEFFLLTAYPEIMHQPTSSYTDVIARQPHTEEASLPGN